MKAKTGKRIVDVWIGESAQHVGTMTFQAEGQRETLAFCYSEQWLMEGFAISPDLPLVGGHQGFSRKLGALDGFPAAFSEAEPDGWGKRVIRRVARQEKEAPPKSSLDFLLGVDDHVRIGALRFSEETNPAQFLRATSLEATPRFLDIEQVAGVFRAVEQGREVKKEILFLSGLGTSLGGMRPKCSFIEGGQLFIGKFPSVNDERNVVRGEMLALALAKTAGLNAADAKVCQAGKSLALAVARFDRTSQGRVPFLSAGGMLGLARGDEFSYQQLIETINMFSPHPAADRLECWKRMVFNLLISNVDDHARNHGFLYAGRGKWRLSPAFDLNPFPEKERTLKTHLYDDGTPVEDIESAVDAVGVFGVDLTDAKIALIQMSDALLSWKKVAQSSQVGMSTRDVSDYAPAFDNVMLQSARRIGSTLSAPKPTRTLRP